MAATRSKTASETKRGYQEGDETLVLLEQQQSTMKTFISAFMDSVNVRVDSLIKDKPQNPIDLILVELISKSFLYFFKDLKYGTPYLCKSKQFQVFSLLNNL